MAVLTHLYLADKAINPSWCCRAGPGTGTLCGAVSFEEPGPLGWAGDAWECLPKWLLWELQTHCPDYSRGHSVLPKSPACQEKAGRRAVGAPQADLRSHIPPRAGHGATASLILNHLLGGLGFSPVPPHSPAGASISYLCWIHHANLVFVPGISPGNESGVDGRSWEHFTLTHRVRAGDAGR